MDFNTLDEEIEWETRRVAAAFDVDEWITEFRAEESDIETNMEEPSGGSDVCFGIANSGEFVRWLIYHSQNFELEFRGVVVSPDEQNAMFLHRVRSPYTGTQTWELGERGKGGATLMARGLYRLGFEDKKVIAQLPELSAHEKLELRLSMPREFWPQQWRDEVN